MGGKVKKSHPPNVPKDNKAADSIVVGLFIGGLLLTIWEIVIYRETIIGLTIPLCLCFTPGVLLTPIFYRTPNKLDGTKGHWILHYLLHSFTTGAVLMFSFMALNFYGASEDVTTYQFDIISKDSIPGPRGTVVNDNLRY